MQLRVEEPDVDIQALTPTPTVRLAAGLVTFVGLLCALSGFQLFMSVRFLSSLVSLVPWFMLLLGLPLMYVGAQLYRMAAWAALTGAIGCGLIGVGLGVWTVFAVTNGLLSCLTIVTPLVAFAAGILSASVRARCQRADVARDRLRDAGYDLGV